MTFVDRVLSKLIQQEVITDNDFHKQLHEIQCDSYSIFESLLEANTS